MSINPNLSFSYILDAILYIQLNKRLIGIGLNPSPVCFFQKRWHTLPDGTKIQRDLYSAFLLYCSDDEGQKPDRERCQLGFENFQSLHDECIQQIKTNRKVVLNSGIIIS